MNPAIVQDELELGPEPAAATEATVTDALPRPSSGETGGGMRTETPDHRGEHR